MSESRYLRRSPANDETPESVDAENANSLPYWNSSNAVVNTPSEFGECGQPVGEINKEPAQPNVNWKTIAIGFVGGLIFTKLVR
jgi:hypothetical protein